MKILFFFLCSLLVVKSSYGQQVTKALAVDTTLFLPPITLEHSNDSVSRVLRPGKYRVFFQVKVDVTIPALVIEGRKIKSAQKFIIKPVRTDTYLDFDVVNEEWEVTFRIQKNSPTAYPIENQLAYVYTAHTKDNIPPFSITDLQENTYSNQSLLGKTVILNFWGITCGPCVEEMPQLNSLVEKYKRKQEVVFIAITADQAEKLKPFLTRHIFDYKVVDKGQKFMENFVAYTKGFFVLPLHMIINKEGKLVYKHIGTHDQIVELLSQKIDSHL